MSQDFMDRLKTTTFEKDVEFALNDNPAKILTIGMDMKPGIDSKHQITDHFSDLNTTPIVARNQPTPLQDVDATRYWIHKMKREAIAFTLDPDDEMATTVGVKGALVQGVAAGINRYKVRQFFKGFYGPTFTGDDGTTQQAFLPAHVLGADFGETPLNYTGLTLNKLRKVKTFTNKRLWNTQQNNVTRLPTWIITADEAEDLLEIDQYVNTRYNPKMETALQSGEITSFMGFDFLCYEFANEAVTQEIATTVGFALNALGHRRTCLLMPEAMAGREWLGFKGHNDIRTDLSHVEQIAGYSNVRFGRRFPAKCAIVEVA